MPPTIFICPTCDRPYVVAAGKPPRTFCSRACAVEANIQRLERLHATQHGDAHPRSAAATLRRTHAAKP